MGKKDFSILEIHLINELDKFIDKDLFEFTGEDEIELVYKDNHQYFLRFYDVTLPTLQMLKYPMNLTSYERFPDQIDSNEIGGRTNVEVSSLIRIYDSWRDLVNDYERIDLPADFNDYIRADQQKFYDQIKFADEAADYEPFEWQEAIVIDEYLEKSLKLLESHEKATGQDLTELKDVAQDIKDTQGQLSKNAVLKKLSKFWALVKRQSIPLFKQIFVESAKTIVGEVVKGLLG